ncbi:MAG: hypothetical protein DBX01_05100 [Puniceicoccaceae bacterium]|nr:MAG: hypothetical protein DBX01_05100 [Puniceicoccaceae bacterium]
MSVFRLKIYLSVILVLGSIFSSRLCAYKLPSSKPNILFILVDDMGYADISVLGQKKYRTPHIDAIFHGGTYFTNGYVTNSVCAPSRAGLITGRLGSYFGFEANLPESSHLPDSTIGLDPEQKTIADVLKPVGYKSICIGKWHLGYNDDLFHPNNRGFDEFFGLLGGSRSYYKIDYDRGNSLQYNGSFIDEPDDMYITDYLTDKAVALIKHQVKLTPEQPFFMYMSYTAPHVPMHAKESDLERVAHIEKELRRTYAAMVLCVDDNVGRLQACLDELGISDNTLIVFLSDNGGPIANGSWNGQLRGNKGSLWEGGIRVPFALKWPGVIPAKKMNHTFVSSVDLLPTFAAVSGADQFGPVATDGMNLMPLLQGEAGEYRDRAFFWRRGDMKNVAVRYRNYKYIMNRRTNEEYLFDLRKDISERDNMAVFMPDYTDALRTIQAKWEASVPDPGFSSDWEVKESN